ncbi:TonB-dependent receptor plug domain-containing protein [Pedobacter deserti]|uniref:TonB-dependent receptor plug domain-containing protein n=1 Tax=Pedobacter deserti TaxID=2817382 RepID=UPI00210C0027|nr:TonB-dependent receptor plug domain-containing protein [Pedobacter sp. SYSU D00382]
MKFKPALAALISLSLCLAFAGKIQDDPFTALLSRLAAYNEQYAQEKVHLHLDKPYYTAGEDIWFKAYVINARTSALSTISAALYVELISESDSIRQQRKVALTSGIGWGDFKLPDSLAAGNYRIRAYTRWMRNAGPEYFFDKTIKIGQASAAVSGASSPHSSAVKSPQTGNAPKIDVQFFPEGGNLVENLPGKVGVKALNPSGRGEDISGVIVDARGNEISSFRTAHLGMGSFMLNPQPGQEYTAIVRSDSGRQEQRVRLPRALANGYVLSVNQTPQAISVRVLISAGMQVAGELKLVTQHNGNVYFTARSNAEKQLFTANIPKKDLPTGIVQLTLFNPANQPVCERLVFVKNNNNRIDLQVNTAKKQYEGADSVSVQLRASISGKPVQGSFSVSVTNTSVVPPDEANETNILTSLLLSSDLPGYIEQPNSYFLEDDEETAQRLDHLMLTQGWRRFRWGDIINGPEPVMAFKPEKDLQVSGSVVTLGGKPSPQSTVSLFSTTGGFFAADTVTDAQGRFSFKGMAFPDSTTFVVQARNAKNRANVEIRMDPQPGQPVTRNKNRGDITSNIQDALSAYLKASSNVFDELRKRGLIQKAIVLDEVNIVQKKNEAKNSSNLNGAGNADAIITGEQLSMCNTLSQCLQGRVAGLMIRNGMAYLLRNGNQPMRIMLDGMMMEPDFLDNINPFDVESIEVLKSINYTAIYGLQGGGGVLVITTKRGGGSARLVAAPGITTYSAKGYYTPREFYVPKYGTPQAAADLRTTVYWQPHVSTDNEGRGAFGFYNSSKPGIYRIVVEGIDLEGNLARSIYHYEVK